MRALASARASCALRSLAVRWVPDSALLSSEELSRFTLVRGDVCDEKLLSRALGPNTKTQTVFHIAAQAIVGTARANPRATFETNVQGTWALLEACRAICAWRKSSSGRRTTKPDGVAGSSLPHREDAPSMNCQPRSVTALVGAPTSSHRAMRGVYDVPVCITRCGNLFGGGDLNWNRLIPGTVRAALENTVPIIRSDGQFTRDYLYVEDAGVGLSEPR